MICSTLLLALSLAPQELKPPVLREAPLTLAVDAATALANGLTTDRVWYKRPVMVPGNTPSEHPENPGQPYFSGLPPWVYPGVEIDAFSTNVNYLAVTSAGVIDPNSIPYEWAGLAVSVKEGAEGQSGSILQQNLGQPNGADVYEFMFEGSQQGNPDQLVLAMNENQITLSAGTDNPEITAFDLYAAVLTHPSSVVGVPHGAFESVVFSLTKDSAELLAQDPQILSWFQREGLLGYVPDGGSLIRVDWEDPGTGVKVWGQPYLFRTAAEMGLTAQVGVDTVIYDLTAVAHHRHSGEDYLLFSGAVPEGAPVGTPVLDPLLFLDLATVPSTPPVTPTELRTSGGVLVSTEMKLKLGVDKIDALSAFDPRMDLTKIVSVGDGTPGVLESRMFRDISYPGGNPDCDLRTAMIDPTGTVLSDTAVLLGRFPDAVPTVHAVLPWSAGTARYTIGDVPAILFGVPYQTQWVALLGSAAVATSDWQSIDI